MPTNVISTTDATSFATGVSEAAAALRRGALVIFPTETVYGVAASAADAGAMERLAALRGPSAGPGFTVHIPDRRQARRYLTAPSDVFRRLAKRLWPGPVTLATTEEHPDETELLREYAADPIRQIYRDGRIGLRCPDHPVASRLLGEAGVPVVATPATRPGDALPTTLDEALRALDGLVDYALDGGRTRYGRPSTVVEVSGNAWYVVRAGVVDERVVARAATSDVLFICTGNSCRSPMAEHLFRQRLAERLGLSLEALSAAGYRVASAGTSAYAGAPASSGAIEVLAERSIDASDHRSQPLTVELVQRCERIFVMTEDHRRSVLDLVPSAGDRVALLDPSGPVSDPFGGSPERYRACAEQIARLVDRRVEEFVDEDRDW